MLTQGIYAWALTPIICAKLLREKDSLDNIKPIALEVMNSMMKILMFFAIAGVVANVAGCGKLTAYNTEWCRDKGPLGGHCAWTYKGESSEIPKAEWDMKRFGMFCTSEQGFAANQLFFEQACEKTKGCNIEELKKKYFEMIKLLKE